MYETMHASHSARNAGYESGDFSGALTRGSRPSGSGVVDPASQNDRDVVGAAVLVPVLDELRRDHLQVFVLHADLEHLGILDGTGEAVRAEEVDVACARRLEARVDLHGVLHAER